MDEGRMLIFMIIVSVVVGAMVLLFHPEYTVENVLASNKRYYPQVTDQTIDKETLLREKLKVIEQKKEEEETPSTVIEF